MSRVTVSSPTPAGLSAGKEELVRVVNGPWVARGEQVGAAPQPVGGGALDDRVVVGGVALRRAD